MTEISETLKEPERLFEEEKNEPLPELQEERGSDEELCRLKNELEELKSELRSREELDRAREKMDGELARFREYFPDTELTSVPDEIWERVKEGESLAGAFALYLRRGELEKSRIREFNEKTRKMSSGALDYGGGEKYYSPNEVRKMTPAQVRSNYDDIIESMRHWN